MKFANASELDRKSGLRWGEPGAPVDFRQRCFETKDLDQPALRSYQVA
jgi:hypothetical protein